MNLPSAGEEQAPSFQPAAVLDRAIPSPIPWHQAQSFLREVEAYLRLAPVYVPAGDATLRILVERIPPPSRG
jgi:hypothetical protein